jgi:hypothetical protein
MDIAIIIAGVAIAISIFSIIFSWRHSESVFRRTRYPAVAWRLPQARKTGHNTTLTTDIYNHGSGKIIQVFFAAYMKRGIKREPWCRMDAVDELPPNETLTITVTEELEKDIAERFHNIFYDDGWGFKGKVSNYKLLFKLTYQPTVADTEPVSRKTCVLLEPIVADNIIDSWQLRILPLRKWILP